MPVRGLNGTVKRKASLNQPTISDGHRQWIQCENTDTRVIVHVDALECGRSGVPGSISNAADLTIGAKTVSTRANNDGYNGNMDEVSVTVG